MKSEELLNKFTIKNISALEVVYVDTAKKYGNLRAKEEKIKIFDSLLDPEDISKFGKTFETRLAITNYLRFKHKLL